MKHEELELHPHERHLLPEGQLLYGSIVGFFYTGVAAASFVAAYLNEVGYSGTQVGSIMSVMNVLGIIASPIAGSIADRLRSPRKVLIACLTLASLLYLAAAFCGNAEVFGMPLLLIVLPLWSFFKSPLASLTDSFAVQTANRKGTFTFGALRWLGSFGNAVMCIILGRIVTRTGTNICVFYLYGLINLIVIILLVMARGDDIPQEHTARKKTRNTLSLALSSFYFKIFLVSYMLTCVPVFCLSTFLPYKLVEITGTSASFGALVAFKAFMEIPTLILGGKLMHRFGIRRTLFCAMSLFICEQSFLFSPGVAGIAVAMCLHGISNGLFMSCATNYIFAITPDEAKASAQTIAGALTSVASIIGSFVGGILIDKFGANGYFTFTISLVILSVLVFLVSVPLGRRLGKGEPIAKV